MDKIVVKALGQTIEHEGEVVLIVKNMPVNCMVLFVDKDTWQAIKDNVELKVGGKQGAKDENRMV